MAYSIKAPEQRFLEVYIGESETPKKVPLAGSLPAPWLIRINSVSKLPEDARGAAWFELYYELFREYIGSDVERMTADQINALAEAWGDANNDEEGATPGE